MQTKRNKNEGIFRIVTIGRKHIPGYQRVLDQVAREKKWLLALKAPPLREVRKNVLKKIMARESFLLVLDGDRVIGWCDIRPDSRTGTGHVGLLYMGLLREYRGRGIGGWLFEKSLEHSVRVSGFESIQLEVFASNRRAIGMYRKFGFKKDGLRKKARKYNGKYEDILLMSKMLRK
jgi:ribosomal protein S18 acetylase RimI-like enzyme